jgi:hypothetical protein
MAVVHSSASMTWSRRLLAASGIAYVFVGLTAFVLPDFAAENFPWNVTEFVAMTIGGWTLGIGLIALEATRMWRTGGRPYPMLIGAWLFSALELLVVLAFLPLLRTDLFLAIPYLVALGLGTASGLLGARGWWAMRRDLVAKGEGMPRWIFVTYALFVAVTGLLAIAALSVVPTGGTIFPEPLGAFTTRAFAAFFAALGAGALPLLFTRDAEPAAQYARAGLYPIVMILAAAISYLRVFDFAARPGGLIYIGAYVVTAIAAMSIVYWHRREGEVRWRPGG